MGIYSHLCSHKQSVPIKHGNTPSSNPLTPESWVALLLGLMMLMAPALGVPTQEMLQDTLKSIIISLMSLTTALIFFWQCRHTTQTLIWHKLTWLPLLLIIYAATSMVWAHTYLAGVESVRWFIFAVIVWLGTNCTLPDIEERIIRGIHWGASVASIWTALQFWVDLDIFPQGPNPASTFVNRNFFAEYAICAIPFSIYLLLEAKPGQRSATWLAATLAINIVALMMTGTRSALMALLVLCFIVPILLLKWRGQFECFTWTPRKVTFIISLILGEIIALGSITTANEQLLSEFGPISAVERATQRLQSLTSATEYASGSFSIRSEMWKATARMIQAHPITGVGAGSWEVQIPIFQNNDTAIETDYYAHNEFLQLIAEYGLVGWVFLISLTIYLLFSAWKTWNATSKEACEVAPFRAITLISLLMLMIVSNAGFPWKLASTSSLFALSLSFLAASDREMTLSRKNFVSEVTVSTKVFKWMLAISAACLITASYLSHRAYQSERALIQGIQLALTITKSGKPNHPYWDEPKKEMIQLIRDGTALNPHYRKLTPMVADELASWGDWHNALWIWESVLASRPYVVAIMINMSRAYLNAGDLINSQKYLEKAQHIQPHAISVKALKLMIMSHNGELEQAHQMVKSMLTQNLVDYNLYYTAYSIAERIQDLPLMIQTLKLRIQHFPKDAVDGWIILGKIYAQEPSVHDENEAKAAFQHALALTPQRSRVQTLKKIPTLYRDQLKINQ